MSSMARAARWRTASYGSRRFRVDSAIMRCAVQYMRRRFGAKRAAGSSVPGVS